MDPSDRTVRTERTGKRTAGQHALSEGRKKAGLWTVAEIGASALGLKGVERHARARVREVERTWIAGGEAERRVGDVLDALCEHGFYIFHDVALPKVGNVDHVVTGPTGTFAIETKSHRGRVRVSGKSILLNGKPPEKDFVSQSWRGAYAIRGITSVKVVPVLCFTRAYVEGKVSARGVRVVPSKWLNETILTASGEHDFGHIKSVITSLGAATGKTPSAVPRRVVM